MKLGRREFLKISGVAAGFAFIQPLKSITSVETRVKTSSQSSMAMLIDVSKCIGCWWCYAACKNYNNLPETTRPDQDGRYLARQVRRPLTPAPPGASRTASCKRQGAPVLPPCRRWPSRWASARRCCDARRPRLPVRCTETARRRA